MQRGFLGGTGRRSMVTGACVVAATGGFTVTFNIDMITQEKARKEADMLGFGDQFVYHSSEP